MEVGSSGISRDLAGFHRILWALSGSRGNSGFHRATLELWNEKYLGAVGDKRLRFPLLSLKNLAFVTSQANCRVSLHPPRLRGPAITALEAIRWPAGMSTGRGGLGFLATQPRGRHSQGVQVEPPSGGRQVGEGRGWTVPGLCLDARLDPGWSTEPH